MHEPLILEVLLNLTLNRLEARQHIAMRMDHTIRFGCCSRCEENLDRTLRSDGWLNWGWPAGLGKAGCKILKPNARYIGPKLSEKLCIAGEKSRIRVRDDPPREIQTSRRIQGDANDAAQYTSEEGSYPLNAILSPQNHAFIRGNFAPDQLCGKAVSKRCQFSVAGGDSSVAPITDDRSF